MGHKGYDPKACRWENKYNDKDRKIMKGWLKKTCIMHGLYEKKNVLNSGLAVMSVL